MFGRESNDNNFVFKWDGGKPHAEDFVSQKFAKLLKQHELPHIRFHDLRHSCCSLLLMWRFPLKEASEWLGHANISITADVYGHLDMSCKDGVANAMTERLLPGLQSISL